MDKEFLGLGITFKGIDKGLDKSLDQATAGFNRTTDAINQLEKSASMGGALGGAFNGLVEGMKLLSISKIGTTLQDMSEGISGTDRTFNALSLTLDTIFAKMSQAFDPRMAQKMNAALVQTVASTGISAEQADHLALGMTNFGRGVNEAVQELPFMGKLVSGLGMDAGKVAQLFGEGLSTLRATPAQMEELVKETAKLGKSYNLTGQVEALPELFASVTKNASRFGLVSADSAIRTTMGLENMVAAFRKVGKSQQEAIGATVSFNDKLGQMQNSVRDMEVGLGPMDESVNDLAQALSMAGIKDPFKIIKQGFDDPQSLIKTVTDQLSGLDSFTQQAVTQRLRRIFGDDVTNLMSTYSGDVKTAVKDAEMRSKKLGSSDKEFDKMTNAMMGTLDVQERLHKTAKDLLQVQLDFATKKEVLDQLARERKAFADLGREIGDNDSILGKLIRSLDIFKKTGIAGFLKSDFSTQLGVVAGMLSNLIFPLTSLLGLIQIFKGPLSLLGSALALPFKLAWGAVTMLISPLTGLLGFLSKISGLTSATTKVFVFFGKNLGIVGKFFADMYTYAGVLFLEGLDKVKIALNLVGNTILKLVTGPFKWLGSAIMRLASTVISAAIGAIQALGAALLANPIALVITAVVALGAAIAATIYYWDDIKAAVSKFIGWFTTTFPKTTAFLVGAFNLWKSAWVGLFHVMLSVATGAWDLITGAFKAGFDLIVGMFDAFQKGGVGGVFDFLVAKAGAVWDAVVAKITDVKNAIFGFFDAVITKAVAIFDNLKSIFTGVFKFISDGFSAVFDFGSILKKTFQEQGAIGVFNFLIEAASKAVDKIIQLFKDAFNHIGLPDFFTKFLTGDKGLASAKEKDLAPNNVINMAEAKERLNAQNIPVVPMQETLPQQGQNRVIPQVNQPGAPPQARQPLSVQYEEKQNVADTNFQALINEIFDLKKTLVSALQQVSDREIKVEIKGDMRKLLRAVQDDQSDIAGARGIANAVANR